MNEPAAHWGTHLLCRTWSTCLAGNYYLENLGKNQKRAIINILSPEFAEFDRLLIYGHLGLYFHGKKHIIRIAAKGMKAIDQKMTVFLKYLVTEGPLCYFTDCLLEKNSL